VEGQIAFYEQHYDEALQKAQKAFDEVPWLYEAKQLVGDIYVEIGYQNQQKGDHIEALKAFNLAGEPYQVALDMARSDASVYNGECSRLFRIMGLKWEEGDYKEEYFNNALIVCNKALLADPENIDAYNKKSALFARFGDFQLNYGQDPRASLNMAI